MVVPIQKMAFLATGLPVGGKNNKKSDVSFGGTAFYFLTKGPSGTIYKIICISEIL